jgi:hypothetical protein
MPSYEDMTTAIEDAITDVEMPDTDLDTSSDVSESTPEPEASTEPVEASPEAPTDSIEVSSPAKSEQESRVQDEFEKKFGITAQSSSGRENRIPYSRVKKITEKAINDAKKEWESSTSPKTQELETKLKTYEDAFQQVEPRLRDYEARLTQVAEFERLMLNEPVNFLKMLVKIPAYDQIFNNPQAQAPAPTTDDMPEPDQALPDGSRVYSMDGLKALLAWNAKQVEGRVTNQIAQRYAPLESSYQQYQQIQSVLPQVQQQIAEARQWPQFTENEDEITKALQQNPSFNLERAYQHVVWPKFQAEREKLTGDAKVNREAIRAELLKELKQAPRSTSATTSATKTTAQKPVIRNSDGDVLSGIEAVIAQAVQGLK